MDCKETIFNFWSCCESGISTKKFNAYSAATQETLDDLQEQIDNIEISGTTYTAGSHIDISSGNVISVIADDFATTEDLESINDAIDDLQAEIETISGESVTEEDLRTVLTNYALSADVQTALANKADISDIPTKTSDLTNDSGFLTEHQSLSDYYTKTQTDNLLSSKADENDLTAHTNDSTIHVTSAEKTTWNNKLDSSDLNGYALSADVDTAIETATNDMLTKTEAASTYQPIGEYIDGEALSAFTYDKATIDEKVAQGGTFDPTQYYTTAQTDNMLSAKVDNSTFNTYTATTAPATYAPLSLTATVNTHTADTTIHVTSAEKQTWNNKADSSLLTALTNTITAHTANTDIHVTTAQTAAWDAKADTADIPTKTSELTNDSGFLTEHQSLSNYYTKAETSGATEIATALANKADTSDIPTIDSALSSTSENPVQNKVIYTAIGNIETLLSNI